MSPTFNFLISYNGVGDMTNNVWLEITRVPFEYAVVGLIPAGALPLFFFVYRFFRLFLLRRHHVCVIHNKVC